MLNYNHILNNKQTKTLMISSITAHLITAITGIGKRSDLSLLISRYLGREKKCTYLQYCVKPLKFIEGFANEEMLLVQRKTGLIKQ